MPILVKIDDVRSGRKGQSSLRAVTGGTGRSRGLNLLFCDVPVAFTVVVCLNSSLVGKKKLRIPKYQDTCGQGLKKHDGNGDDDVKLKISVYFTSEICNFLHLFGTPMALKTCSG